MIIYTMGFTQKSAEQFFHKIIANEIDLVIDVRLNNASQLAGFTKGKDLKFFLDVIAHCEYRHDLTFAPTKELLSNYKKGKVSWDDYVIIFNDLILRRNMTKYFVNNYGHYEKVLLLCSEPTPEHCHRRLIAEAIATEYGYKVFHL